MYGNQSVVFSIVFTGSNLYIQTHLRQLYAERISTTKITSEMMCTFNIWQTVILNYEIRKDSL